MSRLRIALALGTVAVVLSACSSTTSSAPSTSDAAPEALASTAPSQAPLTSPDASQAVPTGYTPEVAEAFVDNCTQAATGSGTAQSTAKAICGCFYRGLESTVPFEEFVAADKAAAAGQAIPEAWQQIGAACQSDNNAF